LFLFDSASVSSSGSCCVCGWGAPSLLSVQLFGVWSSWFFATCVCVRRPLCRNVAANQSKAHSWLNLTRRVACWTSVGIGFGACLRPKCMPSACETRSCVVHSWMAQLYPISCFPPLPLSSSLPARPSHGSVCSASLSRVRLEPPNNFVFLCALTLTALQSAGPRGGD